MVTRYIDSSSETLEEFSNDKIPNPYAGDCVMYILLLYLDCGSVIVNLQKLKAAKPTMHCGLAADPADPALLLALPARTIEALC